MFCAGPNILSQPKEFGPAQNILGPVKGQGINAVKFLGWLKIFGPAQSILGHVKGQEIKLFSNFMPIYFIFLLVQNPINMKGGFFFLNQ